MSSLSVLICTYDRPDMLAAALGALINCTIEKPDQVVVVNGGSEGADQIVQHYTGRSDIDLKLVKTINRNLAASRNVGLAHCTGDIVAMTDDDAEVYPDWVTQMKRIHAEHPEAGAVGGAVLGAESHQSLLSRIADIEVFPSPAVPGYTRTLPGVNISYKRQVVQMVGLQDETLFRGEDVDFNWRVKRLGYEIYYSPDIRVVHHHRRSMKGLVRQFYMYGRAYYLVRQKWPEMYCAYPHGIRRPRDFFKLAYFLGSAAFLPLVSALRMSTVSDRLCAVPVLMATQAAWKVGVLSQRLEGRRGRSSESDAQWPGPDANHAAGD